MRVAPISRSARSRLLDTSHRFIEPEGAVLFRRGEPAFGIFLLRMGSIRLHLEDDEGNPLWDRTVTRDAIVGLPATLAGGRYSLTAVAVEESDLAFIGRETLIGLIKDDPGLGLELIRALGDEVLQMRTVLASYPAAAFGK